ncbi:hypothetical protein [Sphingobacterium olei]|nr:hypothetical protein [Sphingobacterium olei]
MNSDKSSMELYDLNEDRIESTNLVAKHPDLVKQFSEQLLEWWNGLPPFE